MLFEFLNYLSCSSMIYFDNASSSKDKGQAKYRSELIPDNSYQILSGVTELKEDDVSHLTSESKAQTPEQFQKNIQYYAERIAEHSKPI